MGWATSSVPNPRGELDTPEKRSEDPVRILDPGERRVPEGYKVDTNTRLPANQQLAHILARQRAVSNRSGLEQWMLCDNKGK